MVDSSPQIEVISDAIAHAKAAIGGYLSGRHRSTADYESAIDTDPILQKLSAAELALVALEAERDQLRELVDEAIVGAIDGEDWLTRAHDALKNTEAQP